MGYVFSFSNDLFSFSQNLIQIPKSTYNFEQPYILTNSGISHTHIFSWVLHFTPLLDSLEQR